MGKYYQGQYRPRNPSKYKGDPTNIIYRSGWELKLMSYLDRHPNVVKWSSEEVIIPYRSPIDNRLHRYYMDFYVEQINREGKKETILIEVKPKAQTQPPKRPKNVRNKRYINEVKTWGVNQANWEAAQEVCKDRGWKFQIMPEEDLGIK